MYMVIVIILIYEIILLRYDLWNIPNITSTIKRKLPVLFLGTLYSPTDGTIDPTGICTATTRAAKKAGAKVWFSSVAISIDE